MSGLLWVGEFYGERRAEYIGGSYVAIRQGSRAPNRWRILHSPDDADSVHIGECNTDSEIEAIINQYHEIYGD